MDNKELIAHLKEKFNLIKGALGGLKDCHGHTINKDEFRLLAVQLDGFTHRIILDAGVGTEIMTLTYSAYMKIYDYPEELEIALKVFFSRLPHYEYKYNPTEVIFISATDRNKEVDA